MSTAAATGDSPPSAASDLEDSHSRELRVAPALVRFPSVAGCAMPTGGGRCLQVSCRYHLAHPDRGGRPRVATRDCALAVANEGAHTLEEIAQVLAMTRERVRQIEEGAIAKLRRKVALKKLHDAIE